MTLTKTGVSAKTITTRLLYALIIWFLFFSLCYVFLFLKDDHRQEELTKSGVFISKDIASQAGLPLLERNIDRLGELLNEVSERPGVVYASIIDHKNKLIAYTDQKQFLTLNQRGWDVLDDVQYSRAIETNDRTVINFSSEVTFSGTRIGEIFISLATRKVTSKRPLFLVAALLSLALIVAIFVRLRKEADLPLWINIKALFPKKEAEKEPDSTRLEITCPLCGEKSTVSSKEFALFSLNQFPILRTTVNEKKPILLTDLSKVQEMTWLKQRIVMQCTEIINRLIAN
ncbi:MAG: hypothetical protein GY737_19550 [Desulfobacteraceae bacterium]|nr:hypothetical protein [Desulfobacteraceae bacterium]